MMNNFLVFAKNTFYMFLVAPLAKIVSSRDLLPKKYDEQFLYILEDIQEDFKGNPSACMLQTKKCQTITTVASLSMHMQDIDVSKIDFFIPDTMHC
uniref:Uncharacterized protein n=1 Tax=Triticum urartu TaxID=4572 RepID=A0A8R7QGD8_TRIUA